ncbi:CDP-glycerol glycerophosphotransferase family protein [Campylobacter coli]|nr:CDP-glycerol glycerophosphotransferase family protein [Campylobacter coli]
MFFSIIIPAYNASETIGYTLDSIAKQEFIDYEVIIVNDGSTDNGQTLRICEVFKSIHKNINVKIITKENGGLCSARNAGILKAQGQVLIFLDSDDLLPENILKTYYDYFTLYNVDIIQGKLLNFDNKKQWKSASYEKVITNTHILDYDNEDDIKIFSLCISPCVRAYKADFIKQNEIKFLDGCMMTEDHYFSNLLISKKPNILALNQYAYLYRRDRVDQSTNTWKSSYLNDLFNVQNQLKNFILPQCAKNYYERFLIYEFLKIVLNPMEKFSKTEIAQYTPMVLKILSCIPQQYKDQFLPKVLAEATDEKVLYKVLVERKSQRNIKSTLYFTYFKKTIPYFKKIKNNFISFVDYIYRKICKGRTRRAFVVFLYNMFSVLIPIKNNKVTFAIRPSGKLYFLNEIKQELLKNKHIAVKTLLAKNSGFFEDVRIMYHLARSKVIILDGHYWYLFEIKPRKGQEVIQSWHAAGVLKKFGLDMFNINSNEYLEHKKHHTSYTYSMVSCDDAVKAYMSAFDLKENQILKFGNIISDRIMKNKKTQEQAMLELGLDYRKKLVLYAPTFRESYGKFTNIGAYRPAFDFDKIKEELGDEYILACRIHPNYKKCDLPENFINLSSYDESLVLNATEVLITDYSSIVFSFLHFQKPIILYPYDLPIYMGQRNTYNDYEDTPGFIVFNQEDLASGIKDAQQLYTKESLKRDWNRYMQYCDGQTAVRMVNFIENLIKENNVK